MSSTSFGLLCTKCGACCRRVKNIDPDWPVGPDGRSCIHLNADHSCAIYATRPSVCRVDDSRPKELTADDWNRLNAEACNSMQEEDGLPAELRIPLEPEKQ